MTTFDWMLYTYSVMALISIASLITAGVILVDLFLSRRVPRRVRIRKARRNDRG